MAEAGVPGIALTAWWAAFVPAGTPAPIVEKLRAALEKVLAMQETKDFLGRIANDPMPGTPAETRALLEKEIKAWGEYVEIAKIEKQ
jgi:tripartite-type tricarboxylate transporter receptor subunit TctC